MKDYLILLLFLGQGAQAVAELLRPVELGQHEAERLGPRLGFLAHFGSVDIRPAELQ
jgi:hypothetical protein